MAVLFKVGDVDDFPPIPENFPKCGQFYYHESRTTTTSTRDSDFQSEKIEAEDFVDPHRGSDEEIQTENTVERLWDAVKSKFTTNKSSRDQSSIVVLYSIFLFAYFITNNYTRRVVGFL